MTMAAARPATNSRALAAFAVRPLLVFVPHDSTEEKRGLILMTRDKGPFQWLIIQLVNNASDRADSLCCIALVWLDATKFREDALFNCAN
jgi:hypothetical protein